MQGTSATIGNTNIHTYIRIFTLFFFFFFFWTLRDSLLYDTGPGRLGL